MKRPTSPAQMQVHVQAWQQSGLTQKEYCRQHQLAARGKTKMQAYVAVQRKLLILIWVLWRKDEKYNPAFGQQENDTSSNEEPKPLFSLGSEGDRKKVAPAFARATLDELPCNQVA